MSSVNFQNNRVVHRNVTSTVQLGDDRNTLIRATNTKLDTNNGHLDSIDTSSTTISTKITGLKNSQSQNGLGGGDELGVMTNDIRSNTSLANSTLASLDSKATTRDGHLNDIVTQTSGLATESTVTDIDTKLGNRLPTALSTAGNLKVSIEESSAGGDASASNQVIANGHLSTIAGDTTSLNGKITTGENDISAGTGCQQVLVMGKDAFSPFNLEPIRMSSDKILVESQISNVSTGIVNELPISNAKITQGYDSQIASGGDGLQQTLCYGRDNSGNLDALRTDASGHLEITVDDFVKGQANASASFPVTDASKKVVDTSFLSSELISANSFSSTALDTLGYAKVVIYGEQNSGTTVSNSSLKIMGSNTSAGTYYHIGSLATQNYISGRTMLIENVPLLYGSHPRYLKIYNDNSSSATITLRAIMSEFNEYQ